MSPARRPGALTPGAYLKLVLAVYVVASALLPLAHHDIVCHLKSSTHCTTCVVGSSAESAADPAAFAPFALLDAGAAASRAQRSPDTRLPGVVSGRAPPAVS